MEDLCNRVDYVYVYYTDMRYTGLYYMKIYGSIYEFACNSRFSEEIGQRKTLCIVTDPFFS